MRISALIDRLWGDIAAQPLAVALLAAVIVAIAFLAAVGLVVGVRRVERWVRPRLVVARLDGPFFGLVDRWRWRRSTVAGPQLLVDEQPRPGPYPELLPAPGVAQLRNTRAARRMMLEQVEAHLAERSEAP